VAQVSGSVYNYTEINNTIREVDETVITDTLKQFFIICFL